MNFTKKEVQITLYTNNLNIIRNAVKISELANVVIINTTEQMFQ